MADLDDFFAKKDKKKSKVKPKFLTTEELVRNLEDTTKKDVTVKPKNKPEVAQVTNSNNAGDGAGGEEVKVAVVEQEPVVEEEWKEFEEEQRKDYTGLKIGQLTLQDEDDSSLADGDEDDVDSDGNVNTEAGASRRAGGGPWKKVIPAEDVVQIPMEMPKASATTNAAGNAKYVSPALRMQQNQQPLAPMRLKARNRAAPDITNADFFPSLGAARPEEQRKKKNEPAFEEVRHGGRVQRVQGPIAAPVAATNRFQSLDDDS